METSEFDFTVVGSGSAGLYAALKIDRSKKILVVTKTETAESSSKYAQGGIVGVLKENTDDSVETHVGDTMRSGDGLTDKAVATNISEYSDEVIKDLFKVGVDFDTDENGNPKLTLEGAHRVRRILHAGGDATGLHIEQALIKRAVEADNITIWENAPAVELLTDSNGNCRGVIVLKDGKYIAVKSSAVILATGGTGQLYEHTTNPLTSTGDGIALAFRAGAVVRDMEFVQFHPTAFKAKNRENMFLLSEALRGEGARLTDKDGIPFMQKYDERRDLASRDIVSRAVYNETKLHGQVYLDTTLIGREKFLKRFPTINAKCLENGIDPTTERIPTSPAAHYMMGGVKTDISGITSVPNLLAVGEVANTGLHGANRLASNSLLECVVCASCAAKHLNSTVFPDNSTAFEDENIKKIIEKYESPYEHKSFDVPELKNELKRTMSKNVGIIRDKAGLEAALKDIEKLSEDFYEEKYSTSEEYDFRNMLICADLIVKSALKRKESRGGHYRADYPQKDEKPVHYSLSKYETEICYA